MTDLSFSCHAGVTGTAILSVSSKAYHNVLIALYTKFIARMFKMNDQATGLVPSM
jgi:hypothetical protein